MLRQYSKQLMRVALQTVFARRRFKLLMRTSLYDVEARVRALATATDFFSTVVEPIVIRAPFGKSMLVLAPHQDDEAIGCGGAMALQQRSGAGLNVVVLQDGAEEHARVSMSRGDLAELRNAESRAAAKLIDAREPMFLGSGNLAADARGLAEKIRDVIKLRQVDVVFVPFVLDGHRDHRLCNTILADALAQIEARVRVLQYEVWTNCIPNVVVIIDDVIDLKERMLSCFKFANSALDYTHATKGHNMFLSRLVPAGRARYVEAFFEMPGHEYVELVRAVSSSESGAAPPDARKTEAAGA